jgi:hypothetical protein
MKMGAETAEQRLFVAVGDGAQMGRREEPVQEAGECGGRASTSMAATPLS